MPVPWCILRRHPEERPKFLQCVCDHRGMSTLHSAHLRSITNHFTERRLSWLYTLRLPHHRELDRRPPPAYDLFRCRDHRQVTSTRAGILANLQLYRSQIWLSHAELRRFRGRRHDPLGSVRFIQRCACSPNRQRPVN